MHKNTLLIHPIIKQERGPCTTPVTNSTAFEYNCAQELSDLFENNTPGYIYSRIGNPTVNALEQQITTIEGGLGGIAFSSGMSAISTLAFTLLSPGAQIISSTSLFAGTHSLFTRTLAGLGFETLFFSPGQEEKIADLISARTAFIFAETIGNPKIDLVDIEKIKEIKKDIPLIIDSTLTTPILIKPKEKGADLVIHSTSKLISGHGRCIGGIVIDTGNYDFRKNAKKYQLETWTKQFGRLGFLLSLRKQYLSDIGGCMTPASADLTLAGLESLKVRVVQACDTAQKIAAALEDEPRIKKVRYPGLKSHEQHDLAQKLYKDMFGTIFTIDLDTQENAFKFIKRLKLFKTAANLGDTRSLVLHPWSTLGVSLSHQNRISSGMTPGLIRVSIGLEEPLDLLNDILQAL